MKIYKTLKETLHESAIKQLRTYTVQYLENLNVLQGGTVDIFSSTDSLNVLDKIKNLLNKATDYLNLADLIFFFIIEMQKRIKLENAANDRLSNLVSKEALEKIANELHKEILLLPRNYDILVPFPGIELPYPTPLHISDSIFFFTATGATKEKYPKIESLNEDHKTTHLLGRPQPKPLLQIGSTYLVIPLQGFAYNYISSTIFINATRIAKQVVATLMVNKITEKTSGRKYSLFSLLGEAISESCIIYPAESNEEPVVMNMREYEREFIASLQLNSKKFEATEMDKILFPGVDLTSPEGKQKKLQDMLKQYYHLFQINDYPGKEHINKERERVKTSLEWYFDGLSNENQTFSFIQYSVAFEALLGDPKERKDVVERLSDRCAFLIAKNSSDRESIKKKFEETYDIRSKIIHQGKTKLTDKDLQYYRLMEVFLEKALVREIRNLPAASK